MVKYNIHLFSGELHRYLDNPSVYFVQVFQQVEAGTAMDMREVEIDMRIGGILEMDQLLLNTRIFQEGELVFAYLDTLAQSGILVQIIVLTEFMLVQQLVNHFAAFAAEAFVFKRDYSFSTGFTAVVTADLFL